MMRTVVMVSGGGTNLQAILDAALSNIEIVAVLSDNPDAYGLERARLAGISAVSVDYKAFGERADFNRALSDTLKEINPDLIVLAGFMRILADDLVEQYLGRMLNIHPSLLPAYPGLNTYQRVLDAGENYHGTTVHFVIPELDAGPAVLQYRVAISESDDAQSLARRVQQGEYLIYPQAIEMVAGGQLVMQNGVVYSNGEVLAIPEVIDEQDSTT